MLLAAINWHTVFFMLFAAVACAFALGVLFAQNVVRMAFYLIVSLASTAALFMLAGAEFVGAMQIMIYVGGTLVLLIFGVMLTAQANFISLKTRAGEWILAAIFGGSLLVLLLAAAFSVSEWRSPRTDQRKSLRPKPRQRRRLVWGFSVYASTSSRRRMRLCAPACPAICCHLKLFRFICLSCWWGLRT